MYFFNNLTYLLCFATDICKLIHIELVTPTFQLFLRSHPPQNYSVGSKRFSVPSKLIETGRCQK